MQSSNSGANPKVLIRITLLDASTLSREASVDDVRSVVTDMIASIPSERLGTRVAFAFDQSLPQATTVAAIDAMRTRGVTHGAIMVHSD